MVSLPPHLQARPASRRETPSADKLIDELLARRPANRAGPAIAQEQHSIQDSIQEDINLFRERVKGKSLQQLLDLYPGRGALLDLLL